MQVSVFQKEIISNKALSRAFVVIAFVVLTSLGAFVRIHLPFTPVPITLQTFFVLLSGAFLGGTLGGVTQLIYVTLGVAGVSLFTGTGSGWLYFLGPTGGYIMGFVLAALVVGRFIRLYEGGFFSVLLLFAFGDLIILCCGTLWLKVSLGFDMRRALLVGFYPFLIADMAKAAIASSVYMKLRMRLREAL